MCFGYLVFFVLVYLGIYTRICSVQLQAYTLEIVQDWNSLLA